MNWLNQLFGRKKPEPLENLHEIEVVREGFEGEALYRCKFCRAEFTGTLEALIHGESE